MFIQTDCADKAIENFRAASGRRKNIQKAEKHPFEVLREKVWRQKIRNYREYSEYRRKLPEEERGLWPHNPWQVYKNGMTSKPLFYYDDTAKAKQFLELKRKMALAGIEKAEDYKAHRKKLLKEEKVFWPSHPDSTFRGLYIGDFYGFKNSRVKKRPFEYLQDVCRKIGVKTLDQYWIYRETLPPSEKRRWPYVPWEYHKRTRDSFFGRKRGEKDFYALPELQKVLLDDKALYLSDYEELRKKDSKIPSRPYDCEWFSGFDNLFLFRQSPGISRKGRYFFYSKAGLQSQLRMNFVFGNKAYEIFLGSLSKKEARLFPKDIYAFYGGWSWKDPELLRFLSAAELSSAVKRLDLKNREEYFYARKKYPILPENPEEFFDWPANIEGAGYSYSEAWEILFGVYNEDNMNRDVHDPFFAKLQSRRDIRNFKAASRENLLFLENPAEEDVSPEAAMDVLLKYA